MVDGRNLGGKKYYSRERVATTQKIEAQQLLLRRSKLSVTSQQIFKDTFLRRNHIFVHLEECVIDGDLMMDQRRIKCINSEHCSLAKSMSPVCAPTSATCPSLLKAEFAPIISNQLIYLCKSCTIPFKHVN